MVVSLSNISFCDYLLFMVIYIHQFLLCSSHFLSTIECYLYKDTEDILVLENTWTIFKVSQSTF